MKKALRLISFLCIIAMLITGCSGKTQTSGENIDLSSYPIDTDVTLTYLMPLRSALAGMIDNYSETHFAQEAEKRTGVKVDYIHPAVGQESQMLSLLIASGELPDIMWGDWYSYAEGIDAAIDSNIIIPLNDYKKYAPAYFGKLGEVKDWDIVAKTDNQNYYGFMALARPPIELTTGIALRADWLEDLSLERPETIDEWETVLAAFKDQKGATAPLQTRALIRICLLCLAVTLVHISMMENSDMIMLSHREK